MTGFSNKLHKRQTLNMNGGNAFVGSSGVGNAIASGNSSI
jgi:hypothetical protein